MAAPLLEYVMRAQLTHDAQPRELSRISHWPPPSAAASPAAETPSLLTRSIAIAAVCHTILLSGVSSP